MKSTIVLVLAVCIIISAGIVGCDDPPARTFAPFTAPPRACDCPEVDECPNECQNCSSDNGVWICHDHGDSDE